VLGVVGVCSVANRAIAGGISDRIGRVRTFAGGAALAAAGVLVLAFTAPGAGTWPLYLFAILYGLGTGAQTTQTASLASDLYRGPEFAAILGVITLGFGTGGATGPWVAGLVYEWNGSYDAMLWLVLAALVGGSLAMAGAGRSGTGGS